MHAIMDRKLKNYYYPPAYDAHEWYERTRHLHVDPASSLYGHVLVKTKTVRTGYKILMYLTWRDWQWRPYVERHNKHLHWLFLKIWINAEYDEVPDRIVEDHLAATTVTVLSDATMFFVGQHVELKNQHFKITDINRTTMTIKGLKWWQVAWLKMRSFLPGDASE